MDRWTPMGGPHWCTIKEGIQALKTKEGGRWKWAKNPGDGVTRAVFQCNAHKKAGRRAQLKKYPALVRVPVAPPTAADEEEEHLQALGMEGQ